LVAEVAAVVGAAAAESAATADRYADAGAEVLAVIEAVLPGPASLITSPISACVWHASVVAVALAVVASEWRPMVDAEAEAEEDQEPLWE